MNKLLDIFLCGTITIFELIAVLIIAMFIQLIMYQIFRINIYKLTIKGLNKLDRYLNKAF